MGCALGLTLATLDPRPEPTGARVSAPSAWESPGEAQPQLQLPAAPEPAPRSGLQVAPAALALELERAPQAAALPGTIQGTIQVLEQASGAPLAGASVELSHCSNDGERERIELLRSDAQGLVHFRLEAGELRVVAWSESLVAGPAFLALDDETPRTHTLGLKAAHRVQGRVVDGESGQPVAGARVGFLTFSERDAVFTGPDGWFTHPRFPANGFAEQLHVSAEHYGTSVRYLSIHASGTWELPATEELGQAQVGAQDSWIELELLPELSLRGSLVDAKGQALAGAEVLSEGFFRVLPDVASRDLVSGFSDESGEFELRGLRSDISHGLVISLAGYEELCLELEAGPERTRELGRLVLQRESILAGVVLDAEGFPAEDIQVELVRIEDSNLQGIEDQAQVGGTDVAVRLAGHWRETRTDALGGFLFERTQAADYRLLVRRGEEPLVELELGAGELLQTSYQELRLPALASTLSGQVHGAPSGTRVELRRHGHVASVSLDQAGGFRVAGLDLEAPYELLLRGPSGLVLPQAPGGEDPTQARRSAWAHESPVLRIGQAPGTPKQVLAKRAPR